MPLPRPERGAAGLGRRGRSVGTEQGVRGPVDEIKDSLGGSEGFREVVEGAGEHCQCPSDACLPSHDVTRPKRCSPYPHATNPHATPKHLHSVTTYA